MVLVMDGQREGLVRRSKTENSCLTDKEYAQASEEKVGLLSLPFDPDDYWTKHWGMVPFCADLRNGTKHSGLDFELKPGSKVYAATDGVVERTQVGREEGSGEIINVLGKGFKLDYSGLSKLGVKAGDEVKKGDYLGEAVRIPYGEYHVHLGLVIDGRFECPIKYMDEEFLAATKEMFLRADYRSQTEAKCACDCEFLEVNY